MPASVDLVLLKCLQCSTPVPAQAEEVAWVCAQCGQGLLATHTGLAPLTVKWAAARPLRELTWHPFWVMRGRAIFSRRQIFGFGGDTSQPDPMWQTEQNFYVPAFPLPLESLQTLGAALTRQQTRLKAGPPAGPLQNCTLLPQDAHAAAEFIVLTIEADRRDKLRAVEFQLELREGELWVLPFAGSPSPGSLALD